MKKLKKILILIFILFIIVGFAVYIDYFISKIKDTYPKISIMKKINDNEDVYNAVFYRVWYCKTNNKYTIGSYSDTDAICPIDYVYEKGYYTNAAGVQISKRDLELISEVMTSEMIENISSSSMLSDIVSVAYDYGKLNYELYTDENNNTFKSPNGYNIVVFYDFIESKSEYKWDLDYNKKYCFNIYKGIPYRALYDGVACGQFEKVLVGENWCSLYDKTMLVYDEKAISLCKDE